MKAITFHGEQQVSYETIQDPSIVDDADVIVKVNVCAICGSDLHIYHGREKGIDVGTAMGHEFAGEIVEVGKGVKSLRKGDMVMSPFTTSCGQCYYCRMGLTCRCVKSQLFGWVEKGNGLHGGQAGLVRVPQADSTLMKIPEGISIQEAILLGDVLSTGYFCALQAEVKAGGTYAVVGCGPVGLMAVIGARELGAEKVYAIDSVPERLTMAKRFGAIPVSGAEAKGNILQASGGRGADAVMEAVGSGGAVHLAIDLIRPGGIVSSVGVCNDAHLAFSPVEAYNKNLTYKIGRCPARHLMEILVPVVRQHKYRISDIFTHTMSLSEGAHGYQIFDKKQDGCLKILLTP